MEKGQGPTSSASRTQPDSASPSCISQTALDRPSYPARASRTRPARTCRPRCSLAPARSLALSLFLCPDDVARTFSRKAHDTELGRRRRRTRIPPHLPILQRTAHVCVKRFVLHRLSLLSTLRSRGRAAGPRRTIQQQPRGLLRAVKVTAHPHPRLHNLIHAARAALPR